MEAEEGETQQVGTEKGAISGRAQPSQQPCGGEREEEEKEEQEEIEAAVSGRN